MQQPLIGISPRTRKSPYFDATMRAGCKMFTTYNHMYMPSYYASLQEDYNSLVNDVTIWDVAAERQVEIKGPDAAKLTQMVVTRDLSKCKVGQAKYVLMCDEKGGLLNDPVLLKLAEDHFWLSLADLDMLLWVKAIAMCHGMDVHVDEPDVSPMQVQGPKAVALMTDVFGEWVTELKFYRFKEIEFEGMPLIVSRTGWSGEIGYEIFLRDGSYGTALWDRLMEAGKPYKVAPCSPSTIKRIEAGLMSYYTDMDWHNNPYEVGLGWVVDLDKDVDFIGKEALKKIRDEGAVRGRIGVNLGGEPLKSANQHHWSVLKEGQVIGIVTNAVYSPRFDMNIGIAIVNTPYDKADLSVEVQADDLMYSATTIDLPIDPVKKSLYR